MISRKTLLAGMLALCATPVFAGTTLHFKAGAVDPQQTTTLQHFVSTSAQAKQAYTTNYYVVQFKNIITEADKKALESQGAEIFRYIPDDALLVKISPNAASGLADQIQSVRMAVPYLTAFRLSDELRPSVFTSQKSETTVIQLVSKDQLDSVVNQLSQLGGVEIVEAEGKIIVAKVAMNNMQVVAALEGVEWLQPYMPMQLQAIPLAEGSDEASTMRGDYTDLTGYESGTKIMNFDSAWSRGYTGAGQVVSAADTGLDTGEIKKLAKDFGNVTGGYAFGLFSDSWKDPMGHGTHVSGSVMSDGAQSGGLIRGGAFEAEMVAEGMWSEMMNNLTVPPQLNKLFDKAYNDGARIHTNSWGSPRNLGAYDNMAMQVDEYMWENPEMLILFAAGNSGMDENKDGRIDNGSVSSPGTAKNSLTVGASENYLLEGGIQRKLGELLEGKPWGTEPLASDRLSDDPNGIAAFSSVGPTQDGRLKPDVVAPGTNIVSNCSPLEGASPLWGNYNEHYCYSGGTSMSTPLVAGGAAVVRQYLQEEKGLDTPSAAAVKAVLMNTATDLYPGQYGEVGERNGQELLKRGPNFNQGYGRVNMDVATGDNLIIVDSTDGVNQGESAEHSVSVDSGNVKVTLVYTDAPGSPSASKVLVNNLDLKVTLPNGKTLTSTSSVDNSEHIFTDVSSGELKIAVSGTNVPQGKNGRQPYALVVSQ